MLTAVHTYIKRDQILVTTCNWDFSQYYTTTKWIKKQQVVGLAIQESLKEAMEYYKKKNPELKKIIVIRENYSQQIVSNEVEYCKKIEQVELVYILINRRAPLKIFPATVE
jgi:hypothetical protein